MSGLLVVTAVEAEAMAFARDIAAEMPDIAEVRPVGVGPAAAAAGTARLLALAEAAGTPYRAVLSTGIAGGFAGAVAPGSIVVGTACVAADLGADSPAGFLPLDRLGFGSTTAPVDPDLSTALAAALPGALTGTVLTVSTVTGTAGGVALLLERYPDAAAEAMEGYGVAVAAAQAGVPFAELRTVSNPVGPRDRTAWRIDLAFAALATAGATVARELAAGTLTAWH